MKKIPKLQTEFQPLIYNRELNIATSQPTDRTYNVRFPYNIIVTKKRTHFASKSPRTSRRAQNVQPYYINAGDLITAAIGPLNIASPGQHIGAVRDANSQRKDENTTWIGNYFRSLMRGNSGWVTSEYTKEHPLISLAGNIGGDALTLGGPKAIQYLTKMDMPRYGFTPTTNYYFKPGHIGINGIPVGKRLELSPALKEKGWTLSDDETALVNPQGQRFIRNSEGKLQSETSLKETMKNKTIQEDKQKQLLLKKKQQRNLQKIIQNFEDVGVFGFRTKEWNAFRKGFKTTESDIEEYESHVPEYYEIFENLVKKGLLSNKSGQWKGNINGEMVPVNARQYIISNHPNFINNGWKYDPTNRGTAMFPKTAIKIQNNGGIDAANWGTNSNEQLGVFSRQRDNGPILRGLVSTRNNPDRVVPVKHAHEARMEKFKGITEFEGPVGLSNNNNIKGNWRIYGPDMQIKAIDGNNGLFSKVIKNPLSGIIPPILLGTSYYENKE